MISEFAALNGVMLIFAPVSSCAMGAAATPAGACACSAAAPGRRSASMTFAISSESAFSR